MCWSRRRAWSRSPWSARPTAAWTPRPGLRRCADEVATADDLDALCLMSGTLARFKRPRDYRFVDALPENRPASSSDACCDDGRSNPLTEYDGFGVDRPRLRGLATITLDVPEKFNRVSMRRARRARAGVRRARAAMRPCAIVLLRGAGEPGVHRRAGTFRHFMERDAETLSHLAVNVAAARAVPQARDRAAARATASASASSSPWPATSASPSDDAQLALPELDARDDPRLGREPRGS